MAMSDYHVVGDASLAQSPSGQTTIVIQTPDKANQLNYNNTSSGLSATNVQSAIDEVDGRIDALSSNGAKNLLPMTLEGVKALNTTGTWSGNAYTVNSVTFTILTDSDNNVIGVDVHGKAQNGNATLYLFKGDMSSLSNVILNGCPQGGSNNTYNIFAQLMSSPYTVYGRDTGSGVSITSMSATTQIVIGVFENIELSHSKFYPMIRLATDTDATFQPYAKTNLQLTNDVRDIDYRLEGNACVNLLDVNKCVSVTSSVIRYPAMNFLANKGETFYFTFNSGATRQIAYAITDSNGTTTYDSGWVTDGRHVITMPADGSIFVAFKYSDNSTITLNDVIETFMPMLSRIDGATYEPYYPSNKELGKWIPKTKTFSGTTNSNGNLEIGDYANMVITSIEFTSSTGYPVALPMKINGHIDLHVINGATNEKLANTAVSGTLYYYEL